MGIALRHLAGTALLAGGVGLVACVPAVPLLRHTVVVRPTLSPEGVTVTPARVLLMDGEQVTFQASVRMSDGSASDAMRWQASGVATYKVDSRTGLFAPGQAPPGGPVSVQRQPVLWRAQVSAEPQEAPGVTGVATVYGLTKQGVPITPASVSLALGLSLDGPTGPLGPSELSEMGGAAYVRALESGGYTISAGLRRELEAIEAAPAMSPAP